MNAQSLVRSRRKPESLPTARRTFEPANHSELAIRRAPRRGLARLSSQEWRRRLWHFAPGVAALILTTVPRLDPVPLPITIYAVLLGIVIPVYLAFRLHCRFRRHPEEDCRPVVLGYAIPISLAMLLFRGHLEIAFATAAIIAFGDGSATLFGLIWGGERIAWNPRKTWAGLLGFLTFGTLAGTFAYWLGAHHADVTLLQCLRCVAPAVALCAIVETLPLRINDNISVGISAATGMILMQTITIGW